MEIGGEYRIAAPRQKVWAALSDPDVLGRCLPGCQALERTGPDTLTVTFAARIGPLSASFSGTLRLREIVAPERCTIEAEGSGGVAGLARGTAEIRLAEAGAETVLSYTAQLRLGGKLAELGDELVEITQRRMAGEFAACLSQHLASVSEPATMAVAAADPAPEPTAAPAVSSDTPTRFHEGHHAHPGEPSLEHAAHVVEDAAIEVEEQVEEAAVRSGPSSGVVWGIVAFAVVVVILIVTTM